MKTCTGLYTALITPFKDGKLDEETLKTLIVHQIEGGVNGIVLLGTTGEAPTLSFEEKKRILHISRNVWPQGHLIAGIGSPSTQTSIDYAQLAQDEGMDALLVITPYYNKPTQEGIFRHFEEISHHANLPIIAYSNQTRTGVNLDVTTLLRLSDIPQIIGVKEASGNISQMMDILAQIPTKRSDFSVLAGDDAFTFPLMSLGAQGVICTCSNLFPKKMAQLVHLCKTDLPKARKEHFELLPLFHALSITTNPIPIKAAMAHFTLASADVRLPLTPLSSLQYTELTTRLRRFQ